MKKQKKAERQRLYYLLGGLALVLVVVGAYAFSSGNLFQGALRPIKNMTVTDVKKTTTPISKIRLPQAEGTVNNDYTLTPSDATSSGSSTTAVNDYVLNPSDATTLQNNEIPNVNLTDSTSPLIRTVSPLTTIQTVAPTIGSVSIDKKFFKPDVETLKITYDLQGVSPATILYVVIYDNDGNNVYRRQFTATEDPQYLALGTHYLTWDGKDFYGKTVPPNGYYVKVYGKRNTDNIAEKRANLTVLNKNLTYAGTNTPVQWPYSFPTITNLTLKENSYVPSTGKYRVKVAFELYASSSDNQIWMGFRDDQGVQYNNWTFKDLPNGKYELFWDGMRYTGEMINTWTQPNYILNTSGYDNNVYRPEMAKELKLTLPASY